MNEVINIFLNTLPVWLMIALIPIPLVIWICSYKEVCRNIGQYSITTLHLAPFTIILVPCHTSSLV